MSDSKRKDQHISLTSNSQTTVNILDRRFDYEPLFSAHPTIDSIKPNLFLGKTMNAPIWVSSMTGGATHGKVINHNLARIVGEFGLGMGLGSCRSLLTSDQYLEDFMVRDLVKDAPLFANLGICQLEKLYINQNFEPAKKIVSKLQADGMIIHVNPLQEWFQKEGDRLLYPAIDSIKSFIKDVEFPVIIKEVGQGFGPSSLEALIDLQVAGIEFGAFGGTNFSVLEATRCLSVKTELTGLCFVGHEGAEMLKVINRVLAKKENTDCHLVVSGGIKSSLDGHYLVENSNIPTVFGMASVFLNKATGKYSELKEFTKCLLEEYAMAKAYLRVKPL